MKCIIGMILAGILLLAPAPAVRAMDVAAAEKLMKTQLGDGFRCRSAEMFVCAGDMDRQTFDAIVDGTVSAAAKALWKQYFAKKPKYAIRVYLFSDEKSYRKYAKELFNDTNVSYFGYYKPDEKALVMNIGTGTGTLVHEMVHALMEPDFPAAPTWFSEGLASLYEQCRIERDGLVGLKNWRLAGLRDGIRQGTTLPLEKLVATTRAEFLDKRLGVHYAQARYFCQYMQEKELLRDFYRGYRDGYPDDKTGAVLLEKLFKKPLPEVEKDWLVWVEKL